MNNYFKTRIQGQSIRMKFRRVNYIKAQMELVRFPLSKKKRADKINYILSLI